MDNYVKILQDVKDDTMINQKLIQETLPQCRRIFLSYDNNRYQKYNIDRQYRHIYALKRCKYYKPQKKQYETHNKITNYI